MYTLNAEQARQLDRFQTTENFAIKNSDKYAILKPFANGISQLADNNKQINLLIPARSTDGAGATVKKRDLKAEIATSVNTICSLVIPYALNTGDSSLYNAVNFTTTDVITLRDAAVFGFVSTLVGVITPLLSSPGFADYPVTAAALDALTKDAGAFNDSLGENKMMDKNSSIASGKINALLAGNRVIIAKLSKLVNYFQATDSGFVDGFRKASALNNSGIRHSGVRGVISNSNTGQPIEQASVILAGKTNIKSTATDSDGAYEIMKFRAGKAKLTITTPGYESQTVEVTITRGSTNNINVRLLSQVISLATA